MTVCIRAGLLVLLLGFSSAGWCQSFKPSDGDGQKERQYLVATLTRIADPVLQALSRGELHKKMPVEAINAEQRRTSTHLEAFGRLLAGMAPWLELGPDDSPEGQLR